MNFTIVIILTKHFIVLRINYRFPVKTPQQKRREQECRSQNSTQQKRRSTKGRNTKTPRVHNVALQKRRTIIKSGIQSLDVEDDPDYP
jgi:hypothetical protein